PSVASSLAASPYNPGGVAMGRAAYSPLSDVFRCSGAFPGLPRTSRTIVHCTGSAKIPRTHTGETIRFGFTDAGRRYIRKSLGRAVWGHPYRWILYRVRLPPTRGFIHSLSFACA